MQQQAPASISSQSMAAMDNLTLHASAAFATRPNSWSAMLLHSPSVNCDSPFRAVQSPSMGYRQAGQAFNAHQSDCSHPRVLSEVTNRQLFRGDDDGDVASATEAEDIENRKIHFFSPCCLFSSTSALT
jgi:hypothetical protein